MTYGLVSRNQFFPRVFVLYQEDSGFTTIHSDLEEIYLLKLLKDALIKRLEGSEIVLMTVYEINHVSGIILISDLELLI